jgi:hypothetical protein
MSHEQISHVPEPSTVCYIYLLARTRGGCCTWLNLASSGALLQVTPKLPSEIDLSYSLVGRQADTNISRDYSMRKPPRDSRSSKSPKDWDIAKSLSLPFSLGKLLSLFSSYYVLPPSSNYSSTINTDNKSPAKRTSGGYPTCFPTWVTMYV